MPGSLAGCVFLEKNLRTAWGQVGHPTALTRTASKASTARTSTDVPHLSRAPTAPADQTHLAFANETSDSRAAEEKQREK